MILRKSAGLIFAPSWLLSLIEPDLPSLSGVWDIAVLEQPRFYEATASCWHYFDTSALCHRPTDRISSWVQQKRLRIESTRSPEMLVSRREWLKHGSVQRNGAWDPPGALRDAWAAWQQTPEHWEWPWEKVAPWLEFLSQRQVMVAAYWPGLSQSPVWAGESFPQLIEQDWQWWLQGKAYDCCCLFLPQSELSEPWPWEQRAVLWQLPNAGQRRYQRWVDCKHAPLWHADLSRGLFCAPLFWPSAIARVENQWQYVKKALSQYQRFGEQLCEKKRNFLN